MGVTLTGASGHPPVRRHGGVGAAGEIFFPHFSPTWDVPQAARTGYFQREEPRAAPAQPRFVISRSPVQIRMSAPKRRVAR